MKRSLRNYWRVKIKLKKITIVSGKGGVGKTTTTSALSLLFKEARENLILVDCDVDAPNLSIVLNCEELERKEIFSAEKAFLTEESCCIGCKTCFEKCPEDAIIWDKENDRPDIQILFCEGCGVCAFSCPENCIELRQVKTGNLIKQQSEYGFIVVTGEIKIGEGNSGKIVAEAKMWALDIAKELNPKPDILLSDGPPGVGCPVIASLSDSDYIILLTEPNPAAIHDLERVLELAYHFTENIGVIINKADLFPKSTNNIKNYLKKNNLVHLGDVPLDNRVAHAVAEGISIIKFAPESKVVKSFRGIFQRIQNFIKE
ncbi:MAG: P-loop NTPase [Candidatus Lokiarchaeota archaeon]|nr:P-loop NTPase [Candidatus Lokiarchaeota archaeon]